MAGIDGYRRGFVVEVVMSDWQRLAEAIKRKGGKCTAAESFIPSMADRIAELEARVAELEEEVVVWRSNCEWPD